MPTVEICSVTECLEMYRQEEGWLDAHPGWVLAGLAGFYCVIVLLQDSVKLVWTDELITYYIAQQPGFRGVWHALAAGADPNPPLMHLLVKASIRLFGSGALAMRLPANVCVLAAIVAVWSMLRRWVSVPFAAAGVLAFMATRGFDYAYDARSYSPMMGFAMVALACWMQSDYMARWGRLACICGMTLALAAGLSSNYYCVLAFFPIAVGEAVRNWRTGRVRPGVWLGLASASLLLLAYLPLIRHNIAEFGPHAWNRPRLSMVGLSYLELVEGVLWPVLGMAAFACWKRERAWSVPMPEAAAMAVLLVYPLLGFSIAVCGAGMISPRCVAPVCCGFGLAAGVLGQRVFGRWQRGGLVLLCVLLLWVTVRESFCMTLLLEQRKAFFALRDRVASEPGGTVLVGDSLFALPLFFYSAPTVQARIVFPVDFAAIHRFEQDDSGEQNLWAGRAGVFPFPVLRFLETDFSAARLLVIARPDGWLARSLQARGISLIPDHSGGVEETENWYKVGGVFTPMAHPDTRITLGGAAHP